MHFSFLPLTGISGDCEQRCCEQSGTCLLVNLVCFSTEAPQVALEVNNMPASAGDIRDVGLIPGLRRSPRGGHGNPLQYSCLDNPMDRGAWRAMVHRVAKSRTQLKRLSTYTHKSEIVGSQELCFGPRPVIAKAVIYHILPFTYLFC